MTQQEAIANIGQPFKLIGFTGMPFDIIRTVTPDGVIEGVFIISARCEDCRLKQPQPEGLKTYQDERKIPGRCMICGGPVARGLGYCPDCEDYLLHL